MNLEMLFTESPRPWEIDSNRLPFEGDLVVWDVNRRPVIFIARRGQVSDADVQLAELLVWASRCVLTNEIFVDVQEFWTKSVEDVGKVI